jgi:hypothetical protein
MAITSRAELIQYCLRRLGHPVIEINVDDDQVEDRINEALQYWHEYHFDGVEKVYLREMVTASIIVVTAPSTWILNELITGAISGATSLVYAVDGNNIALKRTVGTFLPNETITGNGGSTGIVSTFTVGNWDLQFLQLTDLVSSVNRIFRINGGTAGGARGNIFDLIYQFRLNDMYSLMSTDMIYYFQVKQHLSLLDDLFNGEKSLRYNRKQNTLFLDLNWYDMFEPGDFIIVEANKVLDPTEVGNLYDDMFLKRLATAYIKRQWGANLSKFAGIQLPGGVTLNGTIIFDQANTEITKIEDEMISTFSLPCDFYTG